MRNDSLWQRDVHPLYRWLVRLRLPVVVAMVLIATAHHVLLRQAPVAWRLPSMLLLYGVVGPVVVWLLLGWLARAARAAEAANRDLLAMARDLARRNQQIEALHTASRLLAGARRTEELLVPLLELACQLAAATGGVFSWWAGDQGAPLEVRQGRAQPVPAPTAEACLDCWRSGGCPLPDGVHCVPIRSGAERLGALRLEGATLDAATEQALTMLSAEIATAYAAKASEGRSLQALERLRAGFDEQLGAAQLSERFLALVQGALGASGAAVFSCGGDGAELVSQVGAVVPAPTCAAQQGSTQVWDEDNGRSVYTWAGDAQVLALAFETPQVLGRGLYLLPALGAQLAFVQQVLARWTHLTFEERGRLARELHDGLSQMLAHLHLQSKRAETALERSQYDKLPGILAELSHVSFEAYAEVRGAIDDLRLHPLPDETPRGFLERIVRAFAARAGIEVAFSLPAEFAAVPGDAAQLARFLQEGLGNAVRHGAASRVLVACAWQGDEAVLTVSDDGVGFDPQAVQAAGHHGLAVMRERVEACGGVFTLDSAPLAGTTVRAHLPRRRFDPATAAPGTVAW